MTAHTEKVVVLGGTGVAGRAIVEALTGAGYDVVSASRASGVDLVSGQDLGPTFEGASAVVDASNATNGRKARDLLTRGTSHAVEAAAAAGVPHYVLLGIIGSDAVPLPYYELKIGQEQIVRAAPLPTTVLRATQFHPLVGAVLDATGRLRVLPARRAPLQPIDPRDVGAAVAELIASGPTGDARIAGPEILTLAELAEQYGAGRRVPLWIPGAAARALSRGALTDPTTPRGRITFREWVGAAEGRPTPSHGAPAARAVRPSAPRR